MSAFEGAGLPIIPENTGTQDVTSQDSEISSKPEATDEDLLLRLQGGDREAASLLFNRYSRMMLGIAMRVLQDLGEAEDLVQEVFLFLLAKNKLFDATKGTARAWIMHITYHRAYDRRRYLNTRSFYDRTELSDGTTLGTGLGDNVEEFVAWRSCLRPAFERLSTEQHQALTLYFYQGYTIREMCQAMNQLEGNVQHYLYRGLEKLRRYIFHRKCGQRKRRQSDRAAS
jgi:RNA polymerase sigma-70 factor (ECF subfamily)